MTVTLFAKFFGSVSIILCGFLTGNEKLRDLRKKREIIEDLLHLLDLLEENFKYRKETLPKFFFAISLQATFQVLNFSGYTFYEDFSEWKRQLITDAQVTRLLTLRDQRILAEYWSDLGAANAEEEIEKTQWCRAQLQNSYDVALKTETQGKKLYRSLGAAVAAVVAILLL